MFENFNARIEDEGYFWASSRNKINLLSRKI